MINNLFSIFDPSSSLTLAPNWISAPILFILFASLWVIPNPSLVLFAIVKTTLHGEIKPLFGPSGLNRGGSIMAVGLFIFLALNNFIGLFPYIFTSTRHLTTTLTFALPLWLAFLLFGWVNYTKFILAHLVPQSTPPALISFMVLIETVRRLIRPITLSVRLAANIIAGHLLLTLLGNQAAASPFLAIPIMLVAQITLLTLESAVAVIQAYVFIVLSSLYARESTAH